MKINVFLPCKKISTRVRNKNKRPFANIRFGLVKIKLDQLIRAKLVNKIYLSTNDDKIISFVKKLKNKKIIIHSRKDNSLSRSSTMTQQLINHAIKVVPDGHILWTHVTSPFVSSRIYDEVIKKDKSSLRKNYDS